MLGMRDASGRTETHKNVEVEFNHLRSKFRARKSHKAIYQISLSFLYGSEFIKNNILNSPCKVRLLWRKEKTQKTASV